MSQQHGTRQRKAPAAASRDASRTRGSAGKAAGDSAPYNVHAKHHSQRTRSKNKIPKSIRYDLDNALVGLCDVWFEEIKPHLIRNNIKVHIHQDSEGGGPASGDHEGLPPAAPCCSHLNPGTGTSAQGCKLCQLLFNAANSIESAVSQAAIAHLSPVTTSALTPPRVTSSPIVENAVSVYKTQKKT